MELLKGIFCVLFLAITTVATASENHLRLGDAPSEDQMVFVKEKKRVYELSDNVDTLILVTDTHVFSFWGESRSKGVSHEDELVTAGMLLRQNFYSRTNGVVVNAENITGIKARNVDSEYDVLIHINGKKRALSGQNVRIIAIDSGAGTGTLAGFPIHYRDIPEIFHHLGGIYNGFEDDLFHARYHGTSRPTFARESFDGAIHKAFNLAEFTRIAFQGRELEEGEFMESQHLWYMDAGERVYPRGNERMHADEDLFFIKYRHNPLAFLAGGIRVSSMLTYSRTMSVVDIKINDIYYAQSWLRFVVGGNYWGRNIDTLNSKGAVEKMLRRWEGASQTQRKRRMLVRRLRKYKKTLEPYKEGRSIPLAPGISAGSEEFGEELGHWSHISNGPTPAEFDTLTTWGAEKIRN